MRTIQASEIIDSIQELFRFKPILNQIVREGLYKAIIHFDHEQALYAFDDLCKYDQTAVKIININNAITVFRDLYLKNKEKFEYEQRLKEDKMRLAYQATERQAPTTFFIKKNLSYDANAMIIYARLVFYNCIHSKTEATGFFGSLQGFDYYKSKIVSYIRDKSHVDVQDITLFLQDRISQPIVKI